MIVGIDEVGRGCWAGPLVAGAVMLTSPILGLKDSKKLTKLQRTRLDAEIWAQAMAVGLGWVSSREIDAFGLTEAIRLAMRRALESIIVPFEKIVIDGNFNYLPDVPGSECMIQADDMVPSVSAASIVAKVARDRFMEEAGLRFPAYHFGKHVGYGTAAHLKALREHGVCELHRQSFKPVRLIVELEGL